MKEIKISLKSNFENWYSDFRRKRLKDLGCSIVKNKQIYADIILNDFSSYLEFNITKNRIRIKIDMLKSFIFEIFRETSYCHENDLVEENQCMKDYKLQGILSNCFFTNCIHCKNILINVDFNCIDKICNFCNIHYEIKSLSWSKYPPNLHFYKFGEISGVRSFFKNENNIIVLHTKIGYYYTTIKDIITDNNTLFTIENTEKINITFQEFLLSTEKKKKINIQISRKLFKSINKIKVNNKFLQDVKYCFLQIFSQIDNYFHLPWNTKNNFKCLEDVQDTILKFNL